MWDLGQALGRVVAFNQSNQLQEIIDPEMRAPPGHHIERIWPSHIGPGRSNTPQTPTVILKVNALLSPSATPFNQNKLSSIERMKGVGDSKNLIRIELIVCSWLLIRKVRLSMPSATPTRLLWCRLSGCSRSPKWVCLRSPEKQGHRFGDLANWKARQVTWALL